jgi:hypothetical protein
VGKVCALERDKQVAQEKDENGGASFAMHFMVAGFYFRIEEASITAFHKF